MTNDIVFAVICSTLLILLLIVVLVLVFFISGRKRLQQQVELEQTKLSFERELRKVETEVSEHIMSQFAQELHDNIGQSLTAVHIEVENRKLDHPQLAGSFRLIEVYLGEVSQQLRLLSRTLNNDYIGHIGLFSAMQLEVDRLRALNRFEVHWHMPQQASGLDKNQELLVFRIFQELVQNALRHSGASNLHLTFNKPGESFGFTVQDDGKGFDTEQIFGSNKASGLRNIRKRAQMAGLECVIQSAEGKGCEVKIKAPPL
jgi:hypothetical protein